MTVLSTYPFLELTVLHISTACAVLLSEKQVQQIPGKRCSVYRVYACASSRSDKGCGQWPL